MSPPEITREHANVARQMRATARRGWYTGDPVTAREQIVRRICRSALNPELAVSLSLSRDRMHHSVGWWRNVEYEYCWHLSIATKLWDASLTQAAWQAAEWEEFPPAEVRYWAWCIYPNDTDKIWQEPGGTDPRLTNEEKLAHAKMWHLRVFMHPEILDARGEPFHTFIPEGEVYELTRWVDGLTPDKVDR